MLNDCEKEKYSNAWRSGAEGQSRTAWHVFEYLKTKINKDMRILEIGCGNGVCVELLRQEGFNNVYGMDITLEGLKKYQAMIDAKRFKQPIPEFFPKLEYYTESPIWQTPFKDNEFDFTYSTDVMEHLPPELVEQSINEIYRITSKGTFHCIALFKDVRMGINFHLTVQPINWWKESFDKLNTKKINTEIIGRGDIIRKTDTTYRH